jgi:tetratricopeptide (TPR) repeat protein
MKQSSCLILVFLLVSATGGPARADNSEALLQEGIVRYKVGKFQEALELFDRALKDVAPGAAARLHLHRGVVLGILQRFAEAGASFAAALKLQPTLYLEQGKVKRKVKELFDGIREKHAGELSVSANRPDAVVSIDGTSRGKAPFTGRVAVGEHTVAVAAGEARFEKKIVMPIDGRLTLTAELAPAAAPSPVSAPATQPAVDDSPRGSSGRFRWPLWTSVAGGAALVALGVGIGMGISADSAFEDYKNTKSNAEYWELRDTIEGRGTLANVFFGVAGALAVTAAVLYFVVDRPAAAGTETPDDEDQQEATGLRLRLAGAGRIALEF